ncbi:MAG: PA14 domain-containing protein [Candidatus Promineifilaceae bacterium]
MSLKIFRNVGIVGILFLAMILLMTPEKTEAADSTWFAQYFNNTTLSGGPALSQQETTIDHSWGTSSPGEGVHKDNFSVRWTRKVNFPTAGVYRFSGTMDDGMRIWVDDVLVVDAWTTGSERTITGDRYLTAGDHNMKVEFFDGVLFATAKVSWQLVSTTPPTIYNWRGEYYNNKNLSGSPAVIRDDANINFNWNQGTPLAGTVPSDNFSVRWTRNLNMIAGHYQFSVSVDDGVRLWVNNVLLIDKWKDQPLTTYTAETDLPSGSIPIRMEYYDATGAAEAHLSWTQTNVSIANWRGEYYANGSLSGSPVAIRDDASVDFNWGDGSPMSGMDKDNFSVRWTRSIVLPAGHYRFTTRTDDGVRLWVNGQLLIDRWYPQAVQAVDAETDVYGGPVAIKMEYFERTGLAEAHLSWVQTTVPPTGGSGEPGVGTATVASSYLNVRQGPAITYPIISTLTHGTVVQLGGYRNATGTWVLLILANGQQGWSYAPYLQTSVNIASLPVWNEPGTGNTSGATATVYGAYHLNVRTGPGVSYVPIMTIPRGTVVQLIGRNSASSWLKIQLPSGTQGWVSASYMQTTYPISSLPVLTI